MPENKHLRRALYVLYAALAVGTLWLVLRFALPWLLPFLVALLISRTMEPAVRFMTDKLRLLRAIASAVCTILVFAILVTLLSLTIGRAVVELTAFIKDLPSLFSEISKLFSSFGVRIDRFVSESPPEIQNYLLGVLDGFAAKSAELPAELSGKLLGAVSSLIKLAPGVLLFTFTCAISVFFISSGYQKVTDFLLKQIPQKYHQKVRDFKSDIKSTFGKWLKAQLILSGITLVQLCAAFMIMRIGFAILLALLVSVIDALPVLGVGTVLIPWAIVSLISGDIHGAVTLAVTFGVTTLVRGILEPKFVGAQLGIPAIATLLAMYIGFRSFGVLGMVLFPIALILLKHLNDRGLLRLWK